MTFKFRSAGAVEASPVMTKNRSHQAEGRAHEKTLRLEGKERPVQLQQHIQEGRV